MLEINVLINKALGIRLGLWLVSKDRYNECSDSLLLRAAFKSSKDYCVIQCEIPVALSHWKGFCYYT